MIDLETIGLLYGLVLSDGNLQKPKGAKNARFQLSQIAIHEDFTDSIIKELSVITTIKQYIYDPAQDNSYGKQKQIRLFSAVHPEYTKMFERTYILGKKVVDPHYTKLIDWKSLAYIYMADGNKERYSARLHLYFSQPELYVLAKHFKDALNINFNVNRHKTYWYLTLKNADHDKFMYGIEPHIVPSFCYKLSRNEIPEMV